MGRCSWGIDLILFLGLRDFIARSLQGCAVIKGQEGGKVLGFLRLLRSSPMDLAHGTAQGRAHYCIAFLGFSGGCFVFSRAWFVLEPSLQQDAGRKGKGASRLSKENGSMELSFFLVGRSKGYF